jgi:hypothetical protein
MLSHSYGKERSGTMALGSGVGTILTIIDSLTLIITGANEHLRNKMTGNVKRKLYWKFTQRSQITVKNGGLFCNICDLPVGVYWKIQIYCIIIVFTVQDRSYTVDIHMIPVISVSVSQMRRY